MTILVSLPSRPPSPVSRSPPVRARSVSSRSTCSSAAGSSASAWPRFSVTSVIWCLLHLGGYTVKFTVPVDAVAVGVLPDGTSVVVSAGDDGTLRVWRLADGAPVGEPLRGHGGRVYAVA